MNENLSQQHGRQLLRIERPLDHPIEKVWGAITLAEQIGRWYPFNVTSMDFHVGGVIEFDDGAGTSFPATIIEIDPPHRFVFSESPPEQMTRESADLIEIELTPTDTGCLLLFSHTFDDRPAAACYTTGWTSCLNHLESTLDHRAPDPDIDRVTVHEHWIREFDLAAGTLEIVSDGKQLIRFVRQLMRQSRDKTWDVLGHATALTLGGRVPSELRPQSLDVTSIQQIQARERVEFGDGRGGTVTWTFSDGPGGARLELVHESSADESLLEQWRACVESLVKQIIMFEGDTSG